jgi:glycosyltransferase involved in cell wall biosynthesis
MEKKLKVLVCAFACVKDPDERFGFGKGGESGLGWNMVRQISRFSRAWVLTDARNKTDIEHALLHDPLNDVTFLYVQLPAWLPLIKKFPGGIQCYAYVWQIKAYFLGKSLHKKITFDLFHHLTYANDWMASYLGALLMVPYLRGPGGGAHHIPKAFLQDYSFKQRLAETIRAFGQWVFRHDPFFIMGQRRASAVLVCNQEAFDALPNVVQQKAQFFPVNGISQEDFLRISAVRQNKFIIITAGKLIKLKSIDLAIEAFSIARKKIPAATFWIVGDGPEKSRLQELAARLHLRDSIIFKPWMERKELLQTIARSNLFMFPSLRDGGGAVVVEAMAQGVPVICFDLSGPGFHIKKEWGMPIVPVSRQKAIADMAAAIENLYYNEPLRQSIGSKARARAQEYYLWDTLGARLEKIYKKVTSYE